MAASITVDTSAIVDGEIIDSSDITLPIGQLKTSIEDTLNGVQAFDRISFGTAEALTISSGVISPTKTHIVVDTEGAASTDDLVTINNGVQGRWIAIRSTSNSRSVVLKHGTGNIRTSTGQDCTLSSSDVWTLLIHNGTNWLAAILPTVNAVQINTTRTVLGANAASITISSIPATYKHLLLVTELRTDAAATIDSAILRFNSDATAANYYTQYLSSNGTTVAANEMLGASTTGILIPFGATGNTAPATNFSMALTWIFNYASTGVKRNLRTETGSQAGTTTGTIRDAHGAGIWQNTANAISSITLVPFSGSNFLTSSAYTLYGFN